MLPRDLAATPCCIHRIAIPNPARLLRDFCACGRRIEFLRPVCPHRRRRCARRSHLRLCGHSLATAECYATEFDAPPGPGRRRQRRRAEHPCGPGCGKGGLGAAVEGAHGLSGTELVTHTRRTSPGHNNHPFLPPQTLPDRSRSVVWVSLSRYVGVLIHVCVQLVYTVYTHSLNN